MAGKSWESSGTNAVDLKLVAVSSSLDQHTRSGRGLSDKSPPTNYFKSAHWSADGTCVITNSADNRIRTYIIPPELLEHRVEPLQLQPYAEISSHEPADAVVSFPGFDLQDAATTLILSAINEHPIRLNSALTSDLVASYPLINPNTEAHIKPSSLAFIADGSHFASGSNGLISIFDLSRPGQGPVSSSPTGPKNKKATWHNPGTSMRGIVSALTLDRQYNVLAAGALTRYVGLYDAGGFGECVGVFALQGTDADLQIGGQGVTQMLWSPCGRYLYIAERKSNGILMYDIRKTGQLLGWLQGRQANTNQRLGVDLTTTGDGGQHEVWAGGTDGFVRVWQSPHQFEGRVSFDDEHSLHQDAVSSSILHPSGGVLASVSGQRHVGEMEDGTLTTTDVSLRLWSIHKRL